MIRFIYSLGGVSCETIGDIYGVSCSQINGIKNKRYWKEAN